MLEWLFGQYSDYPTHLIVLELTAVVFGLLSVWFSKRNHIAVFPAGMISTLIYVYLLAVWGLFGDMSINAYYFAMSAYGWYYWTRGVDEHQAPISRLTAKEWGWSALLFVGSALFIAGLYAYLGRLDQTIAWVDILTTGIFFVGMWQMAKRKIENWIMWIVGDLISVPLYFYKGLTFTALQFAIFTALAIWGYYSWKAMLDEK